MSQSWDITQSKRYQLPRAECAEEGHTAQIYAIQLRGSLLVSGGADKTLRVWNIDTQRLIRGPLDGHDGSIVSLGFHDSPNQDVLFSGSTDGNVLVRQFSTGAIVKKMEAAHEETVLSLAFDDKLLVTSGRDTKVKIWNRQVITRENELSKFLQPRYWPADGSPLPAYSLLAEMKEHFAAVNSVLLHGSWIIAGAGDRTIAIWDITTGALVHKLVDLHQQGICDLEFDGRFLISGSSDQTCSVYDIEQGVSIARLRGHTNLVRAVVTMSRTDALADVIITGGYDGYVRFWEKTPSNQWECQTIVDTGGFQPEVSNDEQAGRQEHRVFDVAVDETRLIAAGQGPIIKIWDFSG